MKKAKCAIHSEKGTAMLETLPILIIFVMLVAYMLGSFGIVHTGILHSIAARTYAFETFRHRANLVYFRENNVSANEHFQNRGTRFHGIAPEKYNIDDGFQPTQRAISMVLTTDTINAKSSNVHSQIDSDVRDGVRVKETSAVNPVWIKVQYGICIDAKCGDI